MSLAYPQSPGQFPVTSFTLPLPAKAICGASLWESQIPSLPFLDVGQGVSWPSCSCLMFQTLKDLSTLKIPFYPVFFSLSTPPPSHCSERDVGVVMLSPGAGRIQRRMSYLCHLLDAVCLKAHMDQGAFFTYFIFSYLYGCFSCTYVCVPHLCLVPL